MQYIFMHRFILPIAVIAIPLTIYFTLFHGRRGDKREQTFSTFPTGVPTFNFDGEPTDEPSSEPSFDFFPRF
jgi:hypothetical protein